MYKIIIFLLLSIIWYDLFIKRKVVSVYTPTSYFGLGDYIRGIIHLYQQNINCNYNIYINYETHDISKFLYNDCGNNYEYDVSKIQISNEEIFPLINKQSDNLYLYHNAAIRYPIDKTILSDVRQMFTPKKEFQKKINDTLSNLVNGPFSIIHIRLNDDVFLNDRLLNDNLLNNKIKSLSQNNKEIIIMSNSTITKNNLCQKFKLKCINIVPMHTGAIGIKGDIEDTLIEFFIMSKSTKIYQYCESKNQKSGFSQRISEIYEIPIIIL